MLPPLGRLNGDTACASRFRPQGKPPVQLSARCGKCKACLRPTLRKPCLSPVSRTEEEAAAAAAEQAK